MLHKLCIKKIRCAKKIRIAKKAMHDVCMKYELRDRQFFFRKSKIFLPPDDSETSEPEESIGEKFFRKFEFFSAQKSTFIFLVNIIRI